MEEAHINCIKFINSCGCASNNLVDAEAYKYTLPGLFCSVKFVAKACPNYPQLWVILENSNKYAFTALPIYIQINKM
jgi:hypothetical protein